jgi:N-acetylmuramoyl-L-alanine amidase
MEGIGRTTITRRRAFVLGALAAGGSMLDGRVASAIASRAPLRRPRGFGLDVGAGDFHGRTSRVLRAPRRFDLLGVRGPAGERFEVRVRRAGGAWSAWVALAARGDHAPDTGSGERASDPVWAGGCDELQLRAGRTPRGPLRVHFVAVPAARRRPALARAAGAPSQATTAGAPPVIVPRTGWGGDGVTPRSAPRYGVVSMAFVHHTVSVNDYAPEDSPSMVLAIAKYHRDTNGWNDIGYNFLVDQYGQIFEGRAGGIDQPVVGAHAQGYNSQSTGVAVLGTFDSVPISDAAEDALVRLLGWKLPLHGVPCEGTLTVISGGGSLNRFADGAAITMHRISGHRDGDKTACPGNALYASLPALRAGAAALAGPIVSRGTQVTLRPSDRAVTYGADAVFSGTVARADATAAAGAPVAIQKRGSDGRWVTIARTQAADDGAFATRLPWRRGGDVRAAAAGGTSKVATVGLTPLVSTRRPRRHVFAGSQVALSGRIRPATPVAVVLEVQAADGAFRRVRSLRARVTRTTWRAEVRLRRPGLYRLTARTAQGTVVRGDPVLVRAVRNTGGASGY